MQCPRPSARLSAPVSARPNVQLFTRRVWRRVGLFTINRKVFMNIAASAQWSVNMWCTMHMYCALCSALQQF